MGVKNEDGESDWGSVLKYLSLTGYLGFVMVGSILGGLIFGWVLDRLFGTGIVFKIVFLILGIIAGFINTYREIAKRIE